MKEEKEDFHSHLEVNRMTKRMYEVLEPLLKEFGPPGFYLGLSNLLALLGVEFNMSKAMQEDVFDQMLKQAIKDKKEIKK